MALKSATPPRDARLDYEVPEKIPRDQYKRPLIPMPDRADGRRRAHTRSSTFGSVLEDTFGVDRWRRRMLVFGMGRRRDLQLEAAGVPDCESDASKDTLQTIVDRAHEASGADAKANLGTALHALTDQVDRGMKVGPQGEFDGALRVYVDLMAAFVVRMIEVFTVNDRWGTAGTFDRVVSPLGYLVAPDGTVFGPDDCLGVDLKTAASSRYFGVKFAVQLATYMCGQCYVEGRGRIGWPGLPSPPSTKWGLILHLPSDPDLLADAGWWWVDLEAGAELADLALQVRQAQRATGLIVAAKLPTAEHPHDAARAIARLAIASADTVVDLETVWHRHRHTWDDLLTAEGKRRRAEIEAADRTRTESGR